MRYEANYRQATTYLLTFVATTTWLVGAFLSTEIFAQQATGTILQSAKTQVKKEAPTSIRKPHRLIQNPQVPRTAFVEP